MALNALGLGMTLTATNLASGPLKRVADDVQRTAGATRKSSKVMKAGFAIAAGGAVALTASLVTLRGVMGLANMAGEFQQGIAAVGAVANATEQELASLRDTAIQAGIETQFSPTEAVEGLQSLITAGQTARQATSTLVPVLDLAAGSLGQLGVAGAAEAVVGTLNSYQLSADEAANVTDRLLRITQLTNFQARDFEAGLAKAASAGAVFGQELDDVLITMGLLRNANIDASSSSTAFREATRRLGSDQRSQNAITEQGILLFDEETGAMRSVVDVMTELANATAGMTDEERNRIAAQAFGARGLLAFNAISQAAFTTMRNGEQVTLQGAEAIAAMRNELDDATGTAARFREALLDTFEGQKQLLTGTLQTLGIVMGESFASAFKPVVGAVVDGLNAVLQFFNDLPQGAKDAITIFVTAGAAIAAAFGTVMVLTGAVLVLLPVLKATALAFGTMLTAAIPLGVAMAGLIAVAVGFSEAMDRNLGGVATRITRVWEGVKLSFQGLMQLFQDGGFSGAVREEMGRAENGGIRDFVITVFRLGSRVVEFFRGIGEGFQAALANMGPTFERISAAIDAVGEAFTGVQGDIADGMGSLSSAGDTGINVGLILARIFEFVAEGVALAISGFASFVEGARLAFEFFEPTFNALYEAFGVLGDAIGEFADIWGQAFGLAGDSSLSFGEIAGFLFGTVIAGFARVIRIVVGFATNVVNAMAWVGETITKMQLAFRGFKDDAIGTWNSIADSVADAVDTMISSLGALAANLPEEIRPDFLDGLVEAGRDADRSIVQREEARRNAPPPTAARAGILAEASVRESQAARAENIEAARANAQMMMDADRRARGQERIMTVVQIDGETIARAVSSADRTSSERGFNQISPEDD